VTSRPTRVRILRGPGAAGRAGALSAPAATHGRLQPVCFGAGSPARVAGRPPAGRREHGRVLRSWRPSLQRLPPLVQSLWQSTTCAAIHVRKKGQLTAVLTTPTFKNGPELGFCWSCERGGRKVVAFDTTYIRPGRIGENVRPTLVAVHGRDHDRLQSLGLTAARGFHDGARRGSGVGHRPLLRGWRLGGGRR
jgi:hypothetical protein